ncbi:glycosyl hydrolase family 92-domain-containing protein [Suillus fuscotomentosus]|uniref:Glycosyl hydrolase family 92-domain-containing protein n=1 Tax=Suillus fuscotomentosus TaxID=1912939 RepID=A0AAD4DY40_9AGAM|nr:glycosyl hydrolase family 92-domain-containing protein [Suillus fuscotomentosus]KAG1896077.1 glycosyl hydrolase family 92-domain-containing protein [Suillus fuscotomentosus]
MTFPRPRPGLRYRREQPSWAGKRCTRGHAASSFPDANYTNHSLLIFPRLLPRSTSLISNCLCTVSTQKDSQNLIGGTPYQSGALFSYEGNPEEVILRVGISFVSTDQACVNAEEEIGTSSFEEIQKASKALWQEKLSKIKIDVVNTLPNVTEMLYSSLYRASLTPKLKAHLRTRHHSTLTLFTVAGIRSGHFTPSWLFTSTPQSNSHKSWTTTSMAGGRSSGDSIVAQFAVNYHSEAQALGINLDDLYAALVADGQVNPPEWNIMGRQVNVYKRFSCVPFAVLDTGSTGRQTREGSRTLEYAFQDFGIRQVAQVLGETDNVEYYTNRSYWYRNVWDATVYSDGYQGFMQKRFPNGTFYNTDPVDCSPKDTLNNIVAPPFTSKITKAFLDAILANDAVPELVNFGICLAQQVIPHPSDARSTNA